LNAADDTHKRAAHPALGRQVEYPMVVYMVHKVDRSTTKSWTRRDKSVLLCQVRLTRRRCDHPRSRDEQHPSSAKSPIKALIAAVDEILPTPARAVDLPFTVPIGRVLDLVLTLL
jgi:elongation factor Tu